MKPKPDLARYKRLSAARQKTLYGWLSGDPEKNVLPLSYDQAAKRVKKTWREKFSVSELSSFYHWYSDSSELAEAINFRRNVAEFLAENPQLDLDSDKIEKAAQIVFIKEALRTKNAKLFVGLRRLKQKDLDQAMDRDKFEVESIERFIKWRAIEEMNRLADSDIPHGNKVAAMRKIAFKDIDALQKSGKIKLPE